MAAGARRARPASRPAPRPAPASTVAWPRWCEARSARCSTNRRCTNFSTATSCHCSSPSVTCAARTGGSGSTRTSPTSRAVHRAENSATARSAAIEPSNAAASSPSTSSSRTRSTAAANASSSNAQPSLAAQPAAQPLQVGTRPGVPRLVRGRPPLPADAARRPPRPAAAPRPGGSPPGRGSRRRCRRRCPSRPPPRSAATDRSPGRTRRGRRAGRRARWSSRRTWPSRRPGPRAAGRPRAAPAPRRARVRIGVAEPGPRVLQHGRPHRRGEVQPGPARPVQVDRGDDPEALRVALEPVGQPEPLPADPVQHLLTEMPERRVAEVVGQRRGLDDVGVAAAERRAPPPRSTGSAQIRSAMARATWATCRLCVSRLCTSNPAPVGLTTWVTPASRAKNGDAAIRSRSTRNGLCARPAPVSSTPGRRAARTPARSQRDRSIDSARHVATGTR